MYNSEAIISGVIPKYRQLLQILRNQILAGELPAGSKLPSEDTLSATFALSRGTVRKAIAQLEAERLVHVEHGIGTFVRQASANSLPFRFVDRRSWLQRTGSEISYRVITQQVIPAPINVAERLSLAPSTPVIHIIRLELLDEKLIAHTVRYLPEALCPELVKMDLNRSSIHAALVSQSQSPMLRAEMSIEMHAINETEARLLNSEPNIPAIFIDRLTYTAPNRPAVWYRGLFREQYFFGVTVDREFQFDH